jgi:hypothetical protein
VARRRSVTEGVIAEVAPKNGFGDEEFAGLGPGLESRTARIQSSVMTVVLLRYISSGTNVLCAGGRGVWHVAYGLVCRTENLDPHSRSNRSVGCLRVASWER